MMKSFYGPFLERPLIVQFEPPTKLLSLSNLSILIFSRLAMNLFRAWIKESVPVVFASSRRTALLAKQIKTMPYLFNSVLQYLIVKGLNISSIYSMWMKVHLVFFLLANMSFSGSQVWLSTFGILCIWKWCFCRQNFYSSPKNLSFKQLKVNPLTPWATFWWHLLTIMSVTSCFFGKRIGYFRLQFRKEFHQHEGYPWYQEKHLICGCYLT